MTKRYKGNESTKQFHDTWKQKPNCQLGEILRPVYFDSAAQALNAGYDPCDYCEPR